MHPRAQSAAALAWEVAHVERLLARLNQVPDAKRSQVKVLIALVTELHADGVRRLRALPRRNPDA